MNCNTTHYRANSSSVPGDPTGAITFNVSNPAAPIVTVPLTGVSIQGCLLISPNEIDFGTVGAQCASRERVITLYNTCSSTVRLSAVGLNVAPGQPFAVLGLPTPMPAVVPSGGLTFRARYVPQELGGHQGSIFVTTDERADAYNVPVVGLATADAIQRDSFAQESRPAVDLLFVIDNSGSMQPYQTSLAQNFSAFMAYANRQQVDYRIAVTTTDVGSSASTETNGLFVPRNGMRAGRAVPRVLTPQTTNVQQEFANLVNVGTSGSANETGLEAAYRAFSSPQYTTPLSSGGNGGFLRDDALLSIIVVSDEADYSTHPVPFYLNFFQNIKGARRTNLFSLSAIVNTTSTSIDYGGRYMQVAGQTNGIVSSIATQNWAADLERLGQIAFGYKTKFFLTSTPVTDSLEVKIDGIAVPSREPNSTITNWRYDAASNSIEFSTVSLPEPGSTLDLSYTVACGAL